MPAGDRQQAAVFQFRFDQKARQVSPGQTLQDDFLLHQLVGHRALVRAFDQQEIPGWRMAGAVAHDALGELAQLLGCHRAGQW
ncbi:hypothetical protein D3C80_2138410 [compost metagenome]